MPRAVTSDEIWGSPRRATAGLPREAMPWQNLEVTSDTQAIKDAYTEKLKALYTVMADAFIDGESKAAAEKDFLKAVKLARLARDSAINLLP
jgi:hypothetical protein